MISVPLKSSLLVMVVLLKIRYPLANPQKGCTLMNSEAIRLFLPRPGDDRMHRYLKV
jgi:hypothetical protein